MLDLKMSDHVMLHGKPVWGWWRIVPESPSSVPPLEEDTIQTRVDPALVAVP